MRLIVDDVSHTYQPGAITETAALHQISFTLEQGELAALIGHGGSGKSTLALLLAGLYQPTSGAIRLISEKRHDPKLFADVGLVFQYPEQQLFGETVFEEVAFGPRNRGVPEDYLAARVRKALELVGLDPDQFWYRSPFLLSGGQKRRVCIAGVLAMEPKVFLFDEPTAGLDEGGRRWMMDLARRLHSQRKTVLWITHNMEEAAGLAQRVLVLNQGSLLLDGPPAEVFSHEAELRQAHITAPPAACLVRRLQAQGAAIPGQAVTLEEAHQEVLAWLQAGKPMGVYQPPQPAPACQETAAEPEAPAAPEPVHSDADWEMATRAALRQLATGQTETEAAPLPARPQPQPDLDLTGLTGEEAPQVPTWQGGGGDV